MTETTLQPQFQAGPEVETHYGPAMLWFIDGFGNRWEFHRTAIKDEDGAFLRGQFEPGERLIEPGVIYRMDNRSLVAEIHRKDAIYLKYGRTEPEMIMEVKKLFELAQKDFNKAFLQYIGQKEYSKIKGTGLEDIRKAEFAGYVEYFEAIKYKTAL